MQPGICPDVGWDVMCRYIYQHPNCQSISLNSCLIMHAAQSADINECEVSNGGCDHNCTNTDGSYVCSCIDGFVLGGDNRSCDDVNECSSSLCDHTCVNIIGSFRCECFEGYTLNKDGLSCNGTSSTFF